MPYCSKCHKEKDESEMTYYPYLDQWICDECVTQNDKDEEEFWGFQYND